MQNEISHIFTPVNHRFDLIIPSVKLDTLGELTMEDYDFLVEETKDAQKSLFPKLAKTEETEKDPKAPTDNLNA